jgi:antitoxin component HigA of HigAB toxin-antitoxin module
MVMSIEKSFSGGAYIELVKAFPLRPIRTSAVKNEARRVYREVAQRRRSAEVRDYLSVLGSLIHQFETPVREKLRETRVSAADWVEFLLDQKGMTVNALAQKTGIAQSALSQMLRGKRGWSKSAIIKLSKYFKIDPGIFLR